MVSDTSVTKTVLEIFIPPIKRSNKGLYGVGRTSKNYYMRSRDIVDENVMSDNSVSKTVQKLEIPPIFTFKGPYPDKGVTWGPKNTQTLFAVL